MEDLVFGKICICFAILFSLSAVGTTVFSKMGICYYLCTVSQPPALAVSSSVIRPNRVVSSVLIGATESSVRFTDINCSGNITLNGEPGRRP